MLGRPPGSSSRTRLIAQRAAPAAHSRSRSSCSGDQSPESATIDDGRVGLPITAATTTVAIARAGLVATLRSTEQAGVRQSARDQSDRTDGVVVTRDRVVDEARIAVRIGDRDQWHLQLA